MTSQLMRVSVFAAVVSAVAWVGGTDLANGAVKKCPAGKVTRVVNGTRACVPAARFRVRSTPPLSGALSALEQALAGGSVKLRLRNGGVVRPPLPRAVVREILAKYAAAEAELRTTVPAALALPGAGRRLHDVGATGGAVTRSADGSSATATVNFGGTAGAYGVTGKIEFGANVSGRFDVGFDVTTIDPTGATKSTGMTARDILSRNPECPDAAGNLPLKGGYSVTSRSGETFGSKRVHLGRVREATTQSVTSSTSVTFGPDGKAQPFTVRVTASHDYSRSATALAFFGARSRAVGTGSLTATVNPATGQVSGATVTTTGRTSGYEKGQAAADADLRAYMEKLLNEEVGRLLEAVRKAEKNCAGPYDVTFQVKTDANFATHTASGTLDATVTATKNAAGEYTGTVPVSYANLAFASKVGCAFLDPLSTSAQLTVTIAVQPDGLHVKWSADPSATATIQCPATAPDPPPPPIPGQPGPRLISPAPTEFTLPASGGQRTVRGGFQDLTDGWTHNGQITVTPKPR